MIRRYRHITQRPDTFRLNPDAEIAQGLVFAGLAPGGLVGGTHYHDSSLYGNHGLGTHIESSNWIFDSYLGRFVITLDGTNDFFTIPDSPLWNFQENTLSFSFWINRSGTDQRFVLAHGGYGAKGFDIECNTTLLYIVSGYQYCTWTINSGLHHVTINYTRGAPAAAYIDGAAVALVRSNNLTILDYDADAYIGQSIGGTGRWNSVIGDLLIHKRHLSQVEIQQLADPSNTMLSGLILPPRRVMFPAAVASTPSIPSGSATPSAIADLTATGYAQHSGSATLSAIASLTATGYHQSIAYATISATADLTAVGYTSHAGTANLSAIVGLSATGYATHSGEADLSAIADMVAVGEAPSLIPEGSATLSAIADMTAVGYASHAGEAALDAVADIAAVGYRESAGYAVLAAVADMVAVGSVPGEEGGAGTGGKTADGLTWADVDGLEWWEVDGLVWTCAAGVRGVTRCVPRLSGTLSVRSRVSGVVRLRPRMSGSIAND